MLLYWNLDRLQSKEILVCVKVVCSTNFRVLREMRGERGGGRERGRERGGRERGGRESEGAGREGEGREGEREIKWIVKREEGR